MATMTNVNGRVQWTYVNTFTGTGDQEVITLPFEPKAYTIQLTPIGGDARVEASIDDTFSEWEAWPVSNVSITTLQGIMFPIKYLRVVNNTATSSTLSVWGY